MRIPAKDIMRVTSSEHAHGHCLEFRQAVPGDPEQRDLSAQVVVSLEEIETAFRTGGARAVASLYAAHIESCFDCARRHGAGE